MINLKEIVNRIYNSSKEPIGFEYVIKDLQGPHGETQELRVWFERVNPEMYGLDEKKPAYRVYTIIDSVVYEKIYQMPKRGMNLELVVANGLNILRVTLQEEVAYKEMLNYTIADIVKGM